MVYDKGLTTKEAAQKLGIHPLTLGKFIRAKKIPAYNINLTDGRPRYRLKAKDVREFKKKIFKKV